MAHSSVTNTADASAVRMPDYVDDRALSTRTPIARVTWQTMRAKGEGPPFYRLGRRCLYKWSEVSAWIETQRIGGAEANHASEVKAGAKRSTSTSSDALDRLRAIKAGAK